MENGKWQEHIPGFQKNFLGFRTRSEVPVQALGLLTTLMDSRTKFQNNLLGSRTTSWLSDHIPEFQNTFLSSRTLS